MGLNPATTKFLGACDCYEMEWLSQATSEREHLLFVHRNLVSQGRKKTPSIRKDTSLHTFILQSLALLSDLRQVLLSGFLPPSPDPQFCASETLSHLSSDAVESKVSVFIYHQHFPTYVPIAMVSSNRAWKIRSKHSLDISHKPSGRIIFWGILWHGFALALWPKANLSSALWTTNWAPETFGNKNHP